VGHDSPWAHTRIVSEQSLRDFGKVQILSVTIGNVIRALKFYTEGKIVTTGST